MVLPDLAVEALNLHQQSAVDVFTRKTMKRRWLEISLLLVRLAAVPVLAFVFLPAGLAVLFLVVQLAVTGVYLGSVFAVSHIGMEIIPATPRSISTPPGAHLSQHSWWPRRQRVHGRPELPDRAQPVPEHAEAQPQDARAVLQSFCLDHDITYHEVTIHRAWAIVVRYLNQVGLAGRCAYSCPTFAALR